MKCWKWLRWLQFSLVTRSHCVIFIKCNLHQNKLPCRLWCNARALIYLMRFLVWMTDHALIFATKKWTDFIRKIMHWFLGLKLFTNSAGHMFKPLADHFTFCTFFWDKKYIRGFSQNKKATHPALPFQPLKVGSSPCWNA